MNLVYVSSVCCFRSIQNPMMSPRPVLRTIQSILQKEMVREFLGETMSTFVMMVSVWVALGGWEGSKGSSLTSSHC